MATLTKDEARAQLREVKAAIDRRPIVVQDARDAGLTWLEIANILEMTQNGVIKAMKPKG